MVSLKEKKYSKGELLVLDNMRKPSDKNKSLIEACSDSVVVFSEHMLGMTLYYWEIDFLNKLQELLKGGKFSMALALTSRQIGQSTSLAIFATWASFFNKKPDKRFHSTQVLIVSRSFDQAKKLLREIKRTFQDGDRYMRTKYVDAEDKPKFGKDFFSGRLSKEDSNNATMINWRSYDKSKDGEFILKESNATSGIRCYPPTDVVLGETFTIGMVDEAGHKTIEDDWWFDSLKKTGDANKAIWIFTSTPWQPSGFFYEYCDVDDKNKTSYISKHVYTIDTLKYDMDAGNEYATLQYEGVLEDIDRDKALGKFASIKRGYYCEFVKGETSFFDPQKVKDIFTSELDIADAFSKPCDLGVDFGGKSKGSTLCISFLSDEGEIVRLFDREYNHGEDNDMIIDIELLFQRFNIQRIVPDDCPQGEYRIQEMVSKGWEVTPMSFRSEKVSKYHSFKLMVNKGLVKSYVDDKLKEEMTTLEYAKNTKQSYIQHASGYTDDAIDAFLLSSYHFLNIEDKVTFYEW